MKPLNNDNPTCNPISSNCVIWQGPDIACIKLCKGDSISEVTYKLALELCKIMETLNVSNYDLSCFGLIECPPDDFKQLIQLLIKRICEIESCVFEPCTDPGCCGKKCKSCCENGTSGCPDCVVNIAPCFYFLNPQGDQVTTMQLTDYVTAIGNKICDLVSQITTINQTLAQFNTRITNLEKSVSKQVPFSLPTIIPVCVMPSVATDPIAVLQALEAQFCALLQATGTPNDIYFAIQASCLNGTPPPAVGMGGTVPGWVQINNQADAVNNIIAMICDLRNAVRNIQLNCCPTGCDGINIQMQAQVVSGQLKIFLTGTIPAGFSYCGGILPQLYVADTNGNFFYAPIDVIGDLNAPGGTVIPLAGTPVNPSSNLNISITPCFHNNATNATCQYQLATLVINTSVCPPLGFVSTDTTIDYNFTWTGGAAALTVQLYDQTGTVLISSNTHNVAGAQVVNGTFTGLNPGTQYKIRLSVLASGAEAPQICNWNVVNTLPPACVPPGSVTASIIIT
jgi:hypothetical protein